LNSNYADMQSVLDTEKWQSIQDRLAVVTGTAIITVDYKGVPITKHSQCSEFCNYIRSEPKTNAKCEKCDARGGIEAVRINKSYIYRCHCNIIDAAIPIIMDNRYYGCVMVGQVLLKENDENEYIEKIYRDSIELLANQNEMLYLYSKLPKMTLVHIKEIVDLIEYIIKYIVGESIIKAQILEENHQMKQQLNRETNQQLEQEKTFSPMNEQNELLAPAIKYMDENFHKKITLNDMANICFITPGYFSKIFYQKTGEKFSDYLTRLRIESSKELLKTTNKTIQEIAMEVGFNDAGYFTRRFKSYEGITPGYYRRVVKNQSSKYEIVKEV